MVTRPKKAATAATKPDFGKLLAKAKLPEDEVRICLLGDVVRAHEAAVEELKQAQENEADSLAGNGANEIAARIQALEAEMQASIYPFHLRAVPAPRFREFKAAHPIRIDGDEVNKEDLVFGFNVATGFEPMIRLTIVDPVMDDEAWAHLMSVLTDQQFDQLGATAWYLNRGEISVPFSSAASAVMRNSVSGSSSLSDLESHRPDSTDESLLNSLSTSTTVTG